MNLPELVTAYIDYKRSLGLRFRVDAGVLRAFCRAMGPVDLDAITPQTVSAFLAGKGSVSAWWHQVVF